MPTMIKMPVEMKSESLECASRIFGDAEMIVRRISVAVKTMKGAHRESEPYAVCLKHGGKKGGRQA